MAVFLAGCFRAVIRTCEIHVPQMRTPEATQFVARVLSAKFDTNLLIRVETDLERRIVRVTYNSERVAKRNFERALVVEGFDANDLRAASEARAKLPAELQ